DRQTDRQTDRSAIMWLVDCAASLWHQNVPFSLNTELASLSGLPIVHLPLVHFRSDTDKHTHTHTHTQVLPSHKTSGSAPGPPRDTGPAHTHTHTHTHTSKQHITHTPP